jgi:acyl carrier protein
MTTPVQLPHLSEGGEDVMDIEVIRRTIKEAIAKVSRTAPEAIADAASFRDDLGLDSLAVIETIVEVQYRLKIPDLPDGELPEMRTVDDTVKFVQQLLCLQAA